MYQQILKTSLLIFLATSVQASGSNYNPAIQSGHMAAGSGHTAATQAGSATMNASRAAADSAAASGRIFADSTIAAGRTAVDSAAAAGQHAVQQGQSWYQRQKEAFEKWRNRTGQKMNCQAITRAAFSFIKSSKDVPGLTRQAAFAIKTVLDCSSTPRQISAVMYNICEGLENPLFSHILWSMLNKKPIPPNGPQLIAGQIYQSPEINQFGTPASSTFVNTLQTNVTGRWFGRNFAGCPAAYNLCQYDHAQKRCL